MIQLQLAARISIDPNFSDAFVKKKKTEEPSVRFDSRSMSRECPKNSVGAWGKWTNVVPFVERFYSFDTSQSNEWTPFPNCSCLLLSPRKYRCDLHALLSILFKLFSFRVYASGMSFIRASWWLFHRVMNVSLHELRLFLFLSKLRL